MPRRRADGATTGPTEAALRAVCARSLPYFLVPSPSTQWVTRRHKLRRLRLLLLGRRRHGCRPHHGSQFQLRLQLAAACCSLAAASRRFATASCALPAASCALAAAPCRLAAACRSLAAALLGTRLPTVPLHRLVPATLDEARAHRLCPQPRRCCLLLHRLGQLLAGERCSRGRTLLCRWAMEGSAARLAAWAEPCFQLRSF